MFDSNTTQRYKQHFVAVYCNISINSLQFVSTEIHQLKINRSDIVKCMNGI